MPLRAVIFDIGGVLFPQPDRTAHRRWEAHLGLDDSLLGRTIWTMPISAQAEIGRASEDDVWAAVADRFQLNPIDRAALRGDFFGGGAWNDRLIDYARSPRTRYKPAILSKAWPNARTSVHDHVNDSLFDHLIFSTEVGLAKPDRSIYELALDRLHVRLAEAIFIDDVAENVEVARAIGLAGIRYENTEQTIMMIEQYLNASRLARRRRLASGTA